ncbi:MAG TPA: transporter substrate-binding domain-containing protein [Candidatus Corynebacterium avicola]|uniref:Transporter substrate-binding domain-containing protein n=1 Tax=Candidatus Corynebacterium avicola TaxID=2838527 RepID=A0A9D1UL55_9CORY|nr:transporter substrate-binding domain-containing protein [Candidatus Corynebacterium avicola]
MALASCASDGLDLQQWPEQPEPNLALPNGATIIPAGEGSGEDEDVEDSEEPFGSLRPDRNPDTGEEVSPNRRVPDIVERGRLVVGVAQSLNRLGFRDPVTKDMAGFEVDLAKEIARDIFGDPDRIEFRFVEGTGRENALAEGTVDLVLRTMTVTRDRQTEVDFSVPYLTTYPRILAMQNSGIQSESDLADKTVCVTEDSTNLIELQRTDNHGDILTTQTWSDCLLAMQRQQADAIYSDSAILSGLQAQDPYTEIVGDSTDASQYAVAAALPQQRDTSSLVRQVNSTMERIRSDGTWNRLYAKWMKDYLDDGVPPEAKYRTAADARELAVLRREALQDAADAAAEEEAGTETEPAEEADDEQ